MNIKAKVRIHGKMLGFNFPREIEELLDLKAGDDLNLDIEKIQIDRKYKCNECLYEFKSDPDTLPECPVCSSIDLFEVTK